MHKTNYPLLEKGARAGSGVLATPVSCHLADVSPDQTKTPRAVSKQARGGFKANPYGVGSDTRTAVLELLVPPLPSAPSHPRPQQYTLPLESAQV